MSYAGIVVTGSGTVRVGSVYVGRRGIVVESAEGDEGPTTAVVGSNNAVAAGASSNAVVVGTNNVVATGSSNSIAVFGEVRVGEGVTLVGLRVVRGRRRATAVAAWTELPDAEEPTRLGPGKMVKRGSSSVFVYGKRAKITPGDRINGVKVGRRCTLSGDPEFANRMIVSGLPSAVVDAIHEATREPTAGDEPDASASASAASTAAVEEPSTSARKRVFSERKKTPKPTESTKRRRKESDPKEEDPDDE